MVANKEVYYRQLGLYFGHYIKYKSIVRFARKVKCSCEHTVHELNALSERFPAIYFIYDEKFMLLGSVLLRTLQTADLLSNAFDRNIQTLSTQKLEYAKIEGAILLFSKTGIRSISDETIQRLRDAKNILIADPIDSSIENIQSSFDARVTTELNFVFSEKDSLIPSFYLPHAPDWRLLGIKTDSIESKCVYLGHRSKDIFGMTWEKNVEKIYTKDFSFRINKLPTWTKDITKFAFHLTASKPAQASVARPPTKLITALMLGATPIIGKWEIGSTHILGKSYPNVLTSFDPMEARQELPKLLNPELLSKNDRRNLECKTEEMYCPVNHSNQWGNLFLNLVN